MFFANEKKTRFHDNRLFIEGVEESRHVMSLVNIGQSMIFGPRFWIAQIKWQYVKLLFFYSWTVLFLMCWNILDCDIQTSNAESVCEEWNFI